MIDVAIEIRKGEKPIARARGHRVVFSQMSGGNPVAIDRIWSIVLIYLVVSKAAP